MASGEAEELLGREIERNVRLAVGVHDDDVVALVRELEKRTPVVRDYVEVRVVAEPEKPTAGLGDLGVDLDAVDSDVGIELPVRAEGDPLTDDRAPVEWLTDRMIVDFIAGGGELDERPLPTAP